MRHWVARALAVMVLGAGLIAVSAEANPANAQTALPAPQVLTLDQDRLYTDSLYGKAMEARTLAASLALAAENRKIEADLAAEEADLTQKRSVTATAAFQVLADAFDAKVEKLRAEQTAKATGLKTRNDADRKVFFQAAVPVLADLMRQMGAYAILNHDAVVLAFNAIDMTDRAIIALDDKLGDGSAVQNGPRLQTLPLGTVPDRPGLGGVVPGSPAPDLTVPTIPAPDAPAPNTPAPDTPAPVSPTPDTPAPDAAVPNTPAPDASVPAIPAPPPTAPATPPPDAPQPATPPPATPPPATPLPATPPPATPAP